MPRYKLDPFSPSGISLLEKPTTVIRQSPGYIGTSSAPSTTTTTDSRFTDYEGAARVSDEIDFFTFPPIMRDSAGGDWALSLTTTGALYTSPVLQDETNARILDETGDIIIME